MPTPTPLPISIKEIAERLVPFGIQLSNDQLTCIQKYIEILLLWNQKVSLTSIEDPLEIVSRHFGESLFCSKDLFSYSGRLADVGSGAGFPGLALKIAFPELEIVLIEPNLKKCAFLTEVIGTLGLARVQVFRGQYADYRDADAKFDFICSRALGDYKNLLRWARNFLNPQGRAILWIGEEDSILLSRAKSWDCDPPTRIPESRRRVILIGRSIPS